MAHSLKDVAANMDLFFESVGIGNDLKEAEIWGVYETEQGLDKVLSDSGKDIYALLATRTLAQTLHYNDYAVVVTCGWASQNMDSDLPPSQQKDRKRVRLIVVTDKNGVMSSVIRIQGNDEPVFDDGEASGSLADAIKEAVKRKPFTERE